MSAKGGVIDLTDARVSQDHAPEEPHAGLATPSDDPDSSPLCAALLR
jgi:hypothetical protein